MLLAELGPAGTVAHSQSLVVADPHGSGWRVFYALSNLGGGLVITGADFLGVPVLSRASQPFAIVAYHTNPHFKDGIGVMGQTTDGSPYRPLIHQAPNTGEPGLIEPSFRGFVPTIDQLYNGPTPVSDVEEVVYVEQVPGEHGLEPARLTLWAKFQAGNYQYLQHWSFLADGTIQPGMALAAKLLPDWLASGRVHVHNFYFRFEFALGAGQVASELIAPVSSTGQGPLTPSWSPLGNAASFTAHAAEHKRLRVSSGPIETAPGDPVTPSWVIEPGNYVPPDGFFSTADLFVMNRVPAALPETVGLDAIPTDETLGLRVADVKPPVDAALMDVYAPEGGSTLNGDLLIWHVMREYHVPREDNEELPVVPYHFGHFTVRPRGVLTKAPPLSWAGHKPADYLAPSLLAP